MTPAQWRRGLDVKSNRQGRSGKVRRVLPLYVSYEVVSDTLRVFVSLK